MNFNNMEIINMSFFLLIVCGTTSFLCRNKDRTSNLSKINYLCDITHILLVLSSRIIFRSKFISVSLVLRYIVNSRSEFYQTWFSAFRIVFQHLWRLLDHMIKKLRIITQSDLARVVSSHN